MLEAAGEVGSIPKRHRTANYTPAEKNLLLKLVLHYKSIVENKKNDAASCREKELCWKRIEDEFNAQSPQNLYRTAESLKRAYENRKKLFKRGNLGNPDKAQINELEDENAELTLALMCSQQQRVDEESVKEEPKDSDIVEDEAYWDGYMNETETQEFYKKQFDNIATVKLQIAQMELESLRMKRERERMEFDLKMKALMLDVSIKQEVLKKLKSIPSEDCLRSALGNHL